MADPLYNQLRLSHYYNDPRVPQRANIIDDRNATRTGALDNELPGQRRTRRENTFRAARQVLQTLGIDQGQLGNRRRTVITNFNDLFDESALHHNDALFRQVAFNPRTLAAATVPVDVLQRRQLDARRHLVYSQRRRETNDRIIADIEQALLGNSQQQQFDDIVSVLDGYGARVQGLRYQIQRLNNYDRDQNRTLNEMAWQQQYNQEYQAMEDDLRNAADAMADI